MTGMAIFACSSLVMCIWTVEPMGSVRSPTPAGSRQVPEFSQDPAFSFAGAVIDSFSRIDEMQQISAASSLIADDTAVVLQTMVGIRVGSDKLAQASLLIQPFTTSKDEMIRRTARVIVNIYARVLEADQNLLRLLEPTSTPITFLEGSKWLAQKDVALRQLPEVMGVATTVLIDSERSKATATRTLRITDEEKASLLRQLEGLFGDVVRTFPVPGGNAAQVAGAVLWKWLNEPGWKPAVRK